MQSARAYNYEDFQLRSSMYCPVVGGGILIQSTEHLDNDEVVDEYEGEEEFQKEEDYNMWFEDYS